MPRKKSKKGIWLGLLILGAFVLCLILMISSQEAAEAPQKVTAYSVKELSQESSTKNQTLLTGSVVPNKVTKLMTDGERGVISQVHVKVGDHVTPGTLLYTHTNPDGDFAIREAELEVNNQTNLVEQKRMEYTSTESRLGTKQIKLGEVQTTASNAESEEKNSLETEIASLEDEIKLLSRELTEASGGIEASLIALEKAEATLANVQTKFQNKEVTSQVSGVVKKIETDQIDKTIAANAEPLLFMEIVDTTALFAEGKINEFQKETISLGQAVELIDRGDESQKWTGKVVAVGELGASDDESSEAENANLTKYPYKVQFDNPQDGPTLGRHVYVRLITPESSVLTLPKEYVMTEKTGQYVWKLIKEKTVKTKITVASEGQKESAKEKTQGTLEITEGLVATDQLAFPLPGMKDGMAVGADVTAD